MRTGLQRSRFGRLAIVFLPAVGAAIVLILGISWGESHARAVRESRLAEARGELEVAADTAARAFEAELAAYRRGRPVLIPIERVAVPWSPETRPPGEGRIFEAAETLEFVDGRPEDALRKYRQLLDGHLTPTERVTALRNVARLSTDPQASIEALMSASSVTGAADEEALLAAFELSRLGDESREGFLADLRAGRYSGAPPRRRAYLYEDAGGDPAKIPALAALGRILGSREPGSAVAVPLDRIGFLVSERTGSAEVGILSAAKALSVLMPGFEDGRWRLADEGEPLPSPFPPLHLVFGKALEAEVAGESSVAFRERVLLAGGAALLLLGTAVLLFLNDRRRAVIEKRRTDFVWSVTHELKTPIANIMLYAETIREHAAADPEGAVRFSGVIHEEAERLLGKVQHVLDIAAGRRRLAEPGAKFEANTALREIEAAYRAGACAKGVTVEVRGAEQTVSIAGSRELFDQAVGGLLDNALKFAKSEVVLALEKDRGRVRITVEDDGAGISPDEIGRLFSADGEAESAPGSGLGLGLVRQCVENGGGRVSVENRPGGGTLFVLEYPEI